MRSFLDDFRIFCGDLGNEVSDDTLIRAFSRYTSFKKAKVIVDKRTGKSSGYGFVSFSDPNDFTRAMREMNGRVSSSYISSCPGRRSFLYLSMIRAYFIIYIH